MILLQEQAGETLGGSKKDCEVRRQEILGEGPSSLAGLLCKACKDGAADMLRDPLACDVIVELAQAGCSGSLCIMAASLGLKHVITAPAQCSPFYNLYYQFPQHV